MQTPSFYNLIVLIILVHHYSNKIVMVFVFLTIRLFDLINTCMHKGCFWCEIW